MNIAELYSHRGRISWLTPDGSFESREGLGGSGLAGPPKYCRKNFNFIRT
jgi:hypothetical protein